jgi:hypothetical protein
LCACGFWTLSLAKSRCWPTTVSAQLRQLLLESKLLVIRNHPIIIMHCDFGHKLIYKSVVTDHQIHSVPCTGTCVNAFCSPPIHQPYRSPFVVVDAATIENPTLSVDLLVQLRVVLKLLGCLQD